MLKTREELLKIFYPEGTNELPIPSDSLVGMLGKLEYRFFKVCGRDWDTRWGTKLEGGCYFVMLINASDGWLYTPFCFEDYYFHPQDEILQTNLVEGLCSYVGTVYVGAEEYTVISVDEILEEYPLHKFLRLVALDKLTREAVINDPF